MGIIRVHKRKGFFIALNEPFNDKNLSWEARGVMGYLLSKPDGWQCRNYDLINQTKASKHVVKRILKELTEFGYLCRWLESDGRGKIKWMTEVYESPAANPNFTKGQVYEGPTNGLPVQKVTHMVGLEYKKTQARYAVNFAVKQGDFPHISTQACENCDNDAVQYHHYNGYEEAAWFDVVPLCLPCHRDVHKEG